MQTGDVLLLVTSVIKGIDSLKPIIDKVLESWFTPKEEVKELAQKISELEGRIKTDFPKLAVLIRSYSNLVVEVNIAKASSDELAIIVREPSTNLTPKDVLKHVSRTQEYFNRVKQGIIHLPTFGQATFQIGALNARLESINRRIIQLQTTPDNVQAQISTVQQAFDEISNEYTHIGNTLSEVLKEILKSLEP